jgi:hypothetical protein
VEIREIPLRSEVWGELLWQRLAGDGIPTRVVTRVNGERFNAFWLETVTRQAL